MAGSARFHQISNLIEASYTSTNLMQLRYEVGLGLAAGVPMTHQRSPHTHLMGGYQAEGAGPFLGIEEEVLDLRSGSGDILRPRPSWVRRIRKENEI